MPVFKSALISMLLIFCFQLNLKGQVARTPFSSFGVGEYFGNGLTQNQAMGGIGASAPEYWHLNNVNPSLLVFNTITVFEAGFLGEQRTAKGSTGTSEKSGNGNLNYLALGFPVKRTKWGMAVGLKPYTGVNYQLNYTSAIQGSTNTVDVTESGSGGINQLYWSNGVALNSNFSVGLKATYLFSSIINEYATSLTETTQAIKYTTNIYDRQSFTGFSFSPAASFHMDSLFGKKNYQINAGVVYDLKANLNTKFYERLERRNIAGITDSVTLVNNISGTTTIPQVFTAGVSFAKGFQWMIGADFTYLKYSNFKDFNGGGGGTTDGWQFALGGKLTPDPGSLSSYLKRVTYRTGVSIGESPYLINGSPLKDFGINFGLSLPVNRISSLNLGLTLGKRGDLQTNTVEENYFKLYFGVTFNDQWFIKRRFD